MNSDRLRFGIAKPRFRTVALACAALIAAGLVAALAFEWSWLRSPLEHRLSANTGREVSIAELTGRWDQGPRLQLRDVTSWQRRAPCSGAKCHCTWRPCRC
jgi:uncharacterized protein YhdP